MLYLISCTGHYWIERITTWIPIYSVTPRPFKMRILVCFIFSLMLLVALPVVGVLWKGLPVAQYLEFPPITRYVRHAGPSWPLFLVFLSFIMAILWPFLRRFVSVGPGPGAVCEKDFHDFPWWGKCAFVLCLVSWLLAWTRFSWFRPFQPYTFIPLWFSFIFFINGMSHWLTGSSLLERHGLRFVALFPLSTVFWWYFEYLNRFVQNWYYTGVEDFSPLRYVVTASVSFSTVIPAVLSVNELLKIFPRFDNAYKNFLPLRLKRPKLAASLALLLAGCGLMAMGIMPDLLFPLVWIAPLIIVTATQAILGIETVCREVHHGTWVGICRLSASGLICGFFWEMWNFFSYAKWIYSIPFVSQFKIFEMPLLGYAGYLPFGLECAVAASFVIGFQDIMESNASLTARASLSKV